jgi:hypothetical protein
MLSQDTGGSLDHGYAQIVPLLAQSDRHDESTARTVIAKESQLKALEFPQVLAAPPKTFELLSIHDLSGIRQAFE